MAKIYELIKNSNELKDVEFSERDAISLYVYLEDKKKCRACKSLNECKMRIKGQESILNKKTLEITYSPCKYLEESGILNNRYLKVGTLPKKLLNAKLEDFNLCDETHRKAFLYATRFISDIETKKNTKGLYLFGNFLSGKSFLLAAIANELKNRRVDAIFLNFPDFVREAKNSLDKGDFNLKLEEIKKVSVLLIDDLGIENMSEWVRDEILSLIINYRYLNELPTIYATNMSLNSLSQYLSLGNNNFKAAKIANLIKETCEIFKFS